jgi:sulfonate transport system permease protein
MNRPALRAEVMSSDESLALPGQLTSGRKTARSPLQPWRIAGLLLPFAFLGLMEVLVRTHVVPEHLVPAPSTIAETLWQLGGERLARHIGVSSLRVFAGFAILVRRWG